MTAPKVGFPGRGIATSGQRTKVKWEKLTAAVAAAGGLVFWYGLASVSDRLPPPHTVLLASMDIASSRTSYSHIWLTLGRVGAAFVLAFVVGVIGGAMIGLSRIADALLRPWLVLALSIPMPVVIIITVLTVGLGEHSNLIALTFSVAPFVASLMIEAVRNLDLRLDDMARVFRYGQTRRWRHVVIPQVTGALFAAARTGFSLSWKLVVVIEALAANAGVGAMMHRDFRQLEVGRMIGWAIVFSVVMLVIDSAILAPAERSVTRWRPPRQTDSYIPLKK